MSKITLCCDTQSYMEKYLLINIQSTAILKSGVYRKKLLFSVYCIGVHGARPTDKSHIFYHIMQVHSMYVVRIRTVAHEMLAYVKRIDDKLS